MQAVIRARSGISDEQSLKTSPVQSRRWSSSVNAWLCAGNIVRQNAKLKVTLRFRRLNRSIRIVAPKKVDGHTPGGSARCNDGIETRADTSRLLNRCAAEFSTMLHLRFAVP
jgi:hypothetical protein